jgi:TetR/AcrR family transcriptional repressor of nem operon
MGYSQADKEATHERIVQTAANRFRLEGLAGISIADLMKEAGLTHGGFYKHFGSRDELVYEAIDKALQQSEINVTPTPGGAGGLDALLDRYLSPAHRDSPEEGCAVAAFAGEIARNEPRLRQRYTEQIERNIERTAQRIGDASPGVEPRARAILMFSAMVGALNLARAVSDEALSDEILTTVRELLKESVRGG